MAVGGDDETLASTGRAEDLQLLGERSALVAGRYQIVRWLGGGGMGRVYEAFDTELGERVALKVLRGGLSEEALERFRREVKLTRRIVHRNVARMFDIGDHAGDKFLTLELIDGGSLTQALGTQMPWARLQSLAIQICDGLSAAHAAGVVHRDLKPDNVLVERGTDRAVLTDFGIARGADDASVTQLGSILGTPRYMAPEQLAGGDLDARADLFSLGVMLFELATGTRPWSGDNAIAIAVAQATQTPRPFVSSTAPASFGTLIGQCLALEPKDRPSTAAEVRAAIESGSLGNVLAFDLFSTRTPRTTKPLGVTPTATITPLPPPVPTETAIAVLPFTSAAEERHVADGIVEDLVDTLSGTSTLRVRPSGAVHDRSDPDPRAIGAQLGVDHVVVGSVRRVGGQLRVSARLISVADGFQIWAQRAEGEDVDVFAISDRLGKGIAQALSARATAATRPTDPRAVDLYLRARAELRRFWGNHAQAAADLLAQAADYAPSSAPILGAFAYATTQAWIMRGEAHLAERARIAIERGLVSGHGEAYLGSAVFKLNTGDLVGGAADLGTALTRAPMSAQAHETAGRILIELDAVSEGRFHLSTAVGLDPGRTAIVSADLARLDALEGNLAAAMERVTALCADPDPAIAQIGAVFQARLAGWRRDRPAVIAAASRFTKEMGEATTQMLAFIREASTKGGLSTEEWQRVRSSFDHDPRPRRMQVMRMQLIAELALVLDQPEDGLDALSVCSDLGLVDITWLDACPLFSSLHGHPSWRPIRAGVAARAAACLAAFRATAT